MSSIYFWILYIYNTGSYILSYIVLYRCECLRLVSFVSVTALDERTPNKNAHTIVGNKKGNIFLIFLIAIREAGILSVANNL